MNVTIEEKRERVRDSLTTHIAHRNMKTPHVLAAELIKSWSDERVEYLFVLLETRGAWTTHKDVSRSLSRTPDWIATCWRNLSKIEVTDGEQTIRLFRRECELRFRHSGNGVAGGISFRLMQAKAMGYAEVRTITETTHASVVTHVENYRGADAELRHSPQTTTEERQSLDKKRDSIHGATGPQLTLQIGGRAS